MKSKRILQALISVLLVITVAGCAISLGYQTYRPSESLPAGYYSYVGFYNTTGHSVTVWSGNYFIVSVWPYSFERITVTPGWHYYRIQKKYFYRGGLVTTSYGTSIYLHPGQYRCIRIY